MSEPRELTLAEIRRQIDEVDAQLLPLLERRLELAELVAPIKREQGLPVFVPEREQQVLDRLAARAKEPYQAAITVTMRFLMALSRTRQLTTLSAHKDGAWLPSPRSAKAHGALCAYPAGFRLNKQALAPAFPGAVYRETDSPEDALRLVQTGSADYGFIPVENRDSGWFGAMDLLLQSDGCIVGHLEFSAATAEQTLFLQISAAPEYNASSSHTAISFSLEHRSGALWEALAPFHTHNIRLNWIASRPGPDKKPFFFVELEGSLLDRSLHEALAQTAQCSQNLRAHGCYSYSRFVED